MLICKNATGRALLFWLLAGGPVVCPAAEGDAPLPSGVTANWDLLSAYRETTPTRERVCLNGLWRWQPVGIAPSDKGKADAPRGGWGFFKVPACWPGISDYMQYDFQTVYFHPDWKNEKLGAITAAWYQREFTVPADWTGRRITVSAEYLNSFATVYLDGEQVGELRFPGGEIDLTARCPVGGHQHLLSLRVVAMPLKGVMLSYSDTSSAKEVKGEVQRRGLCGDVWLNAASRWSASPT